MIKSDRYRMFANHVKLGNGKLDRSVMIFNTGSGLDCPSYARGNCTLGCGICYAQKFERLRPAVLNYRRMQAAIWDSFDGPYLRDMFLQYVDQKKKRGIRIDFFRYNESGDFKSMVDVMKLATIAKALHDEHGIVTYGYTAAAHLFEGTEAKDHEFTLKMSGRYVKGFASTTVVDKDFQCLNRFMIPADAKNYRCTYHMKVREYLEQRSLPGDHFVVCPAQQGKVGGKTKEGFKCMKDCCLCAAPSINVAFIKH